jgi:hypothetical protein
MKTGIFLGIATALATPTAEAVYLNPHGTGEALVYPYYTVNGGNSTLLSIINTQAGGKAVKVRFLEAMDGRDTLAFNVYLSPYDTWVAQVAEKDGGAALFTNDNTCTVPAIPKTYESAMVFSTVAFDGTIPGPMPTDGGPTDIGRTRDGYIEIIEMGTVTNGTHNTLKAITHSSGMPNDCAQIVGAWKGYWKDDASADVSSPSGGLFGSATILDIDRGTVSAYNADAIAQFYLRGSQPVHTAPESLTPNLSTGTSKSSVTFVDDATLTTPFDRSIDAVSSLFMADQLMNEYVISPSIGAATEWVLTYPTKRFYTDPFYLPDAQVAAKPFDKIFGQFASTSCSTVDRSPFNREEATISNGVGFPEKPPEPQPPTCYAAQVATFAQDGGESLILGSKRRTNFVSYAPFQSGWGLVTFGSDTKYPSHQLTGSNGNVFYGLPVTGFGVTLYVNGSLHGVLSNYTMLTPHKVHVFCNRGDADKPCS